MDAEQITRGVRHTVVFLSFQQAEHYGGYAKAAESHQPALILPASMVEEFWQDLAHLPPFSEVGHA
jgi:hypothetical protein